jgi:hypothetical protein
MKPILKRGRVVARVLAAVMTCVIFLVATAQAATWKIDTVDPNQLGEYSSMKIDRVGNVHLCYVAGQGTSLKYAYWDHTNKKWFTMVVDTSPNICSLALDSKQHPHISYADYGGGGGLRYAHWDGTEWKKVRIPLNSEIIAYYSSIALDANDNPTISFYEYRGPRNTDLKLRLRTVAWNGNYWEVTTIDQTEGSGKLNNMASDSKGHLHLAYANVASAEMRYAFGDGKSWSRETIEGRAETMDGVGAGLGIAIDKADRPHVIYYNVSKLQVKYAVRNNGSWTKEVVDTLRGITSEFDRSSVAFDDEGRPYLGYFDPRLGVLKVAHKEGSKWVVEVVDGNGAGFTNSMQIDRGVVWISYADQTTLTLKVAHRELKPGAAADARNTSESHVSNPPSSDSVKK